MAQPLDVEWLADLAIERSEPLPPELAKHDVSYVYFIQYGSLHEFKIGLSTNPARRLKSLQTGTSSKLKLFDSIETSAAKAGEAYVHRLLKGRCIGGEIFALTPDEAREAATQTRIYLEKELPRLQADRERLAELDAAECTEQVLPATEDLRAAHQRLLELDEDIAAYEDAIEKLADERQVLQNLLKLAIGKAKGIDGIATWETTDGPRRLDIALIKNCDPDLFQQYAYVRQVEKFDTRRFGKEMPQAYANYQVSRPVRVFRLDPKPNSDGPARTTCAEPQTF